MKTCLFTIFAALCLLTVDTAQAAQEEAFAGSKKAASAKSDERFHSMTTNKDGKLNFEEFHTRFPQMPRTAFDAIDLNKDGVINLEEWREFSKNHGMTQERMPPPTHDSGREPGRQLLVMPPTEK